MPPEWRLRRMLGPVSICRLDDALIQRIRRGEQIGPLIASGMLWVWIGAAVYGFTMGLWRSPQQALNVALKLPLLLSLLVGSTAIANAMFAQLLGSRLGFLQSLSCSVLSLGLLSIGIASTSPVALLLCFTSERYSETLVGSAGPSTRDAIALSEMLLAYHVAVIGLVGVVSLRRLRSVLKALVDSRVQARRLFWTWFAVQALTGTQLSWILRPYLGKPQLAVQWLRDDALSGSFVEEVARWFA